MDDIFGLNLDLSDKTGEMRRECEDTSVEVRESRFYILCLLEPFHTLVDPAPHQTLQGVQGQDA